MEDDCTGRFTTMIASQAYTMTAKRNVLDVLDIVFFNGRTRLSAACFRGDMNRIGWYLKYAQIGALDSNGFTALHWACAAVEPSKASLQLLIERGAAVNLTSRAGETPLSIAAGRPDCIVPAIQLLLDSGANADGDEGGMQPLLGPMRRRDTATALEIVKALAFPDRLDAFGWSLIMHACKFRLPSVVAALLVRGASINKRGGTSLSALTLALNMTGKDCGDDRDGAGDMETVALQLIEGGADIRICGKDACSTLHLACAAGYPAAALRLLAMAHTGPVPHVNVNSDNIYGDTALMAAVRALSLSGSGTHGASMYDLVCRLVQCGADVRARDVRGVTALHVACARGRNLEACALLLMDYGADPNARAENGDTPARLAAAAGMHAVMNAIRHRASEVRLRTLVLASAAADGPLSKLHRSARKGIQASLVTAALDGAGRHSECDAENDVQ